MGDSQSTCFRRRDGVPVFYDDRYVRWEDLTLELQFTIESANISSEHSMRTVKAGTPERQSLRTKRRRNESMSIMNNDLKNTSL